VALRLMIARARHIYLKKEEEREERGERGREGWR
jgi:hypothetical protein